MNRNPYYMHSTVKNIGSQYQIAEKLFNWIFIMKSQAK